MLLIKNIRENPFVILIRYILQYAENVRKISIITENFYIGQNIKIHSLLQFRPAHFKFASQNRTRLDMEVKGFFWHKAQGY